MLSFLRQSRENLQGRSMCIVIGNESCDLDSAVCAICLAYCYYLHPERCYFTKYKNFLPVLNIPKRDYPLKTEVNYLFEKFGICSADLSFRDELTDVQLKNSDFVLVDHHVSPFNDRAIHIFDHRKKDPNFIVPDRCSVLIEEVGSCATIIGKLVLRSIQENILKIGRYKIMLQMLRAPIILDTANFSCEAKRFTNQDIDICNSLYNTLLEEVYVKQDIIEEIIQPIVAKDIYKELLHARSNVSNLMEEEILRKDQKSIMNQEKTLKISLPGFPLLVEEFLKKPNASKAVLAHTADFSPNVIILIGMLTNPIDNSIKRDIGIINVNNIKLFKEIVDKLVSSGEKLGLEQRFDIDFMDGQFFKQNNVQATRKHIVSIINELLMNWHPDASTLVEMNVSKK